jgi:hypothetical protein
MGKVSTLDCTNALVMLYYTLSSSRSESRLSVLVGANGIRRCSLCTSLTMFVCFSFLAQFLIRKTYFARFTSIRQMNLKCIIKSRTLLESTLPSTSTCSWWMPTRLLILYRYLGVCLFLCLRSVLGVCGETELANAKQSLITMMQVSP